jgi:hypothetical protein
LFSIAIGNNIKKERKKKGKKIERIRRLPAATIAEGAALDSWRRARVKKSEGSRYASKGTNLSRTINRRIRSRVIGYPITG